MPQKRNPDIAELARSKTGRIYGNLIAILTSMKALPLSYNRDLQEDKEGIFDTIDTLHSSLNIFTAMIRTMQINETRIKDALKPDYILATDLADYLVKRGIPFREAHNVIYKLCNYAISQAKNFNELSLNEYQKFSTLFEMDIYNISVESSIAARNATGGTAPQQVKTAISKCWRLLRDEF
jgi:argininosuccinate lyase